MALIPDLSKIAEKNKVDYKKTGFQKLHFEVPVEPNKGIYKGSNFTIDTQTNDLSTFVVYQCADISKKVITFEYIDDYFDLNNIQKHSDPQKQRVKEFIPWLLKNRFKDTTRHEVFQKFANPMTTEELTKRGLTKEEIKNFGLNQNLYEITFDSIKQTLSLEQQKRYEALLNNPSDIKQAFKPLFFTRSSATINAVNIGDFARYGQLDCAGLPYDIAPTTATNKPHRQKSKVIPIIETASDEISEPILDAAIKAAHGKEMLALVIVLNDSLPSEYQLQIILQDQQKTSTYQSNINVILLEGKSTNALLHELGHFLQVTLFGERILRHPLPNDLNTILTQDNQCNAHVKRLLQHPFSKMILSGFFGKRWKDTVDMSCEPFTRQQFTAIWNTIFDNYEYLTPTQQVHQNDFPSETDVIWVSNFNIELAITVRSLWTTTSEVNNRLGIYFIPSDSCLSQPENIYISPFADIHYFQKLVYYHRKACSPNQLTNHISLYDNPMANETLCGAALTIDYNAKSNPEFDDLWHEIFTVLCKLHKRPFKKEDIYNLIQQNPLSNLEALNTYRPADDSSDAQ